MFYECRKQSLKSTLGILFISKFLVKLFSLQNLQVLFENGVNGILADEMGLGKTIQCVATICQIITMGATGPFIVVAPLSTLPNWKNEFQRFAPRVSH